MTLNESSLVEKVMGVLESAHKCVIGILPYLSYYEIKKFGQTNSIIKFDVVNSNILQLPIYNEDRIHEYHMKWYKKRTICTFTEWCKHWEYLYSKNITYYNITNEWVGLHFDNGKFVYYPIYYLDNEDDKDYSNRYACDLYDQYEYFMYTMSRSIHNNPCIRCGCIDHKDSFGDRTCFCNTCNNDSIHECVYKTNLTNPCIHCGCNEEFNASGERICFCESCKSPGCVHTIFFK